MSAPKYRWWYAWKAEVKRYPTLKKWYDVLPKYTFILPWSDRLTYAAVTKALEKTYLRRSGEEQVRLIDLVLWQGYTISQASDMVHCALPTGQRWHHDFLLLAAKYRGFSVKDNGREEREEHE